jgi:leader peptidase (prepilin peptidase)/N-methyltransferase
MIGAALGWKALPLVVFVGAFLGAAVSIPVLVWSRRRARGGENESDEPLRHVQVPFGPFLALGALVYLFAGRAILTAVGGAWL